VEDAYVESLSSEDRDAYIQTKQATSAHDDKKATLINSQVTDWRMACQTALSLVAIVFIRSLSSTVALAAHCVYLLLFLRILCILF
jgi:hypothetical protein